MGRHSFKAAVKFIHGLYIKPYDAQTKNIKKRHMRRMQNCGSYDFFIVSVAFVGLGDQVTLEPQ